MTTHPQQLRCLDVAQVQLLQQRHACHQLHNQLRRPSSTRYRLELELVHAAAASEAEHERQAGHIIQLQGCQVWSDWGQGIGLKGQTSAILHS